MSCSDSSIQPKGLYGSSSDAALHNRQDLGSVLLALDASDYSLASYQGEEGDQAITKAIAAPSCFVLKPQREGGGKWCPLCGAAAPVKGLAGGHQC